MIERLASLMEMGNSDRPHVLLVDDLDIFDDMSLNAPFEQLTKLDDLRIIASVETRSLSGYTTNPALTALKRSRRLLVLQPDDASDVMQATGVKSPTRPGMRMVPGRGVLVRDRMPTVIQVVLPTSVASSG